MKDEPSLDFNSKTVGAHSKSTDGRPLFTSTEASCFQHWLGAPSRSLTHMPSHEERDSSWRPAQEEKHSLSPSFP